MNKNKPVGYKYRVNIDQKCADDAGLRGKVDLTDLAIMDTLSECSQFKKIKKFVENNKTYYLFHWTIIPKRLPYSRLKSRSSVKSRLKKICELRLLEAHQNNVEKNESWYCFGPLFWVYLRGKKEVELQANPSSNLDGARPVMCIDPSSNVNITRPAMWPGPVQQSGCNDITLYDRTISDNTEDEDACEAKTKNEGFKKQILNDEIWIDKFCMNRKISKTKFSELLKEFIEQKEILEEDDWSDYPDFRKNFYYWIPTKNLHQTNFYPKKSTPLEIKPENMGMFEHCLEGAKIRLQRNLSNSENQKLAMRVDQGMTGVQLFWLFSYEFKRLSHKEQNLNFMLGKLFTENQRKYPKISQNGNLFAVWKPNNK